MGKQKKAIPFRRVYIVLVLALLAALVLLLAFRGAPVVGVILGAVLGATCLFEVFFSSRAFGTSQASSEDASPGSKSKVATDYILGSVGKDSNVLRGTIRKGLFDGHEIGSLHPAEMALIWQDCRGDDQKSAQLIEAHLDAISPRWREDVARGEAHYASGSDGRMSVAEAYKTLGLKSGANVEQIRHAHRDLMLKLHPDRGGSTYLSSKVNEAKDVLLSHLQR